MTKKLINAILISISVILFLRLSLSAAMREPDNPVGTSQGVYYAHYERSSTAARKVLINFNTMVLTSTGTSSNIKPTETLIQIGASSETELGVIYSGYIEVPTDGDYTFYIAAENACRMYIGSTEVVDTDWETHAAAWISGTISLKAGKHIFYMLYSCNLDGLSLDIEYSGPGVTRQQLPDAVLSYIPLPAITGITIDSSTIYENGANTTCRITRSTGTEVSTVYYELSGTASNGVDYGTLTGSAVFSDGQTEASFNISPRSDNDQIEEKKTLTVTVVWNYSYLLLDETLSLTATLDIMDDDTSSLSGGDTSSGNMTMLCGENGYIDLRNNETGLIVLDPSELGNISISIYRLSGRNVMSRSVAVSSVERHTVTWTPDSDLDAGVYILRVKGAGIDQKRKFAVVK